jgi:hypothetical protein
MNEKTIHQTEDEISGEAVEAAGTRIEITRAWTFVCTDIQCGHSPALGWPAGMASSE